MLWFNFILMVLIFFSFASSSCRSLTCPKTKETTNLTNDKIKLQHTAFYLSNDPGKVNSNFFCYAATVLSPHRNVLIFTQRMHKPT